MVRPLLAIMLPVLLVGACVEEEEQAPHKPIDSASGTSGMASGSGTGTDTDDCIAGACGACELPHEPCDLDTTNVGEAFGVTCPDRGIETVELSGRLDARGVLLGLGASDDYDPREGERFTILGTGPVADLVTQDVCSTFYQDPMLQKYDLPPPMTINQVGTMTCTQDPNLIGMGDCSNSIFPQFSAAGVAHDYQELRFNAVVPDEASGVKFDFAFLSSEYPVYYGQIFNDMFVAWLQSEKWTGNIAFDEQGNPISLNAGFLDFRDDSASLPQFSGTCMSGHAGTRWLTSQAAVAPGEEIQMVFAVFDLGDGLYDSFVLLDNFRWGCDEGDMGPSTMPGGTGTGGTG